MNGKRDVLHLQWSCSVTDTCFTSRHVAPVSFCFAAVALDLSATIMHESQETPYRREAGPAE
jgi:hypothetical protein